MTPPSSAHFDLVPVGRAPLVGDVIEFDEPRGLGVVEYGAGQRLTFHCTAITDGTRRIDVGTVVALDVYKRQASDRAATIKALADPHIRPSDLNRPGHIFPLRYRPGGVLKRAGHTEAAVDLAALAGLHPSGVLCEILNEDGTLSRLPELVETKRRLGLKLVSIAQLLSLIHI